MTNTMVDAISINNDINGSKGDTTNSFNNTCVNTVKNGVITISSIVITSINAIYNRILLYSYYH